MRGLACLVAICVASSAHADDPATEAKQHLARALQLHKEKKFAESLDEMKTAYALDPKPELLYAIAQLHVQLGQCDRALPFYERFLTFNPKESAAAKARQAIHICKTAPPPPAAQPDAPEVDQLPDLDTPSSVTSPGPSPSNPSPSSPSPSSPSPRPTVTGPPPWYTDVLGDVLVGAGVIAGGIGVVQYVNARAANTDAGAATTLPERLEHLDDARSKRRIAAIAGGLGGALVIGGIVRFVTRAPTTESRVVVEPGTGGGTVWWRGAF